MNCEFAFNKGDGARLQTAPAPIGTGEVCIRFFGCGFSQNGAHGLFINNATAVLLSGCNGEGNSQDGTSGVGATEGSTIEVFTLGVAVTILNCDFESAGTPAVENLIYMAGTVSSTIQNCKFFGGDGGASAANRAFRNATGDQGIILEGCAFKGFQALADGGIPAGSVVVLRGENGFAVGNYIDDPGMIIYVEDARSIHLRKGGMLHVFDTQADKPSASSLETGALVYVEATALTGSVGNPRAHLQLNAGGTWQTLGGGVIAIFADNTLRPAASGVEAGTLIWVTAPGSAPLEKLQISDGSSWTGIV